MISRFLAYTIPCLYFVGHACGSESLIVLINILIFYTTMAGLICTEIRRDLRQFFSFCFIARLKVVFDIFEQR
jgi:hypothetical protein